MKAIIFSPTFCHFSVLDDKNYAGLIAHCITQNVILFGACYIYFISTHKLLSITALIGLHNIESVNTAGS